MKNMLVCVGALLLVAVLILPALDEWYRENYTVDDPLYVTRVRETVKAEGMASDGFPMTVAREIQCTGFRCSSRVYFTSNGEYLRYEEYDCRTLTCKTTRSLR